MKDPIVESLKKDFDTRSKLGIEKYGTTLQENSQDDFLQHALEEAMDLSLYLKKLIVLRDEKGAESQTISLSKKYKTRQGDDVELTEISKLSTLYKIKGRISTDWGWEDASWTPRGDFQLNHDGQYDLIEVKE